jgi:3-keto-disaccharide hydrolase
MLATPLRYILLLGILSASVEPIPLIRDAGLDGWRGDRGLWVQVGGAVLREDDPTLLETRPGRGVLINGALGKTTNLVSEMLHADLQLHLEFMVPKGSNSGIFLMGRYEVQIADSFGAKSLSFSDCGAIYQRYDEDRQTGWEGRPPLVNASRAPGEWQRLDITFRAPRFDETGHKIAHAGFIKVALNGVVVQENLPVTGPTRASLYSHEEALGPLMLQGDHGAVAFRNIDVVHLNLK